MLGTKRPHDGAGPSQPLVKPEPGTAPYGYRTMPAGMALRPAGVALTGYPAGQQRVLMPAAGGPGMSLGAMPGMPAGARPLQQQQQPGGATMQGRPVLMQGAPGQPPRVVIIPNHAFMQLQAGQGGGVLNLASGAATSALQAAQQQAAQQQAAAAQQQQQAQQQQAALSALGGAIANASAAAVAAAAAAAAAPAAGGGTSASQPPGRCAGRGGGGGVASGATGGCWQRYCTIELPCAAPPAGTAGRAAVSAAPTSRLGFRAGLAGARRMPAPSST
jgi:hypothetical protein